MKAIVYEKNGARSALRLCEVGVPAPKDDEVLVKIEAVSVNAADYRSMRMGILPPRRIFGADVAGQVSAVGQAVTRFKVGDAVVGDLSGSGFGGFAEYAAAPERALVKIPAGLAGQQAAATPMAAVTALQGLRNLGRLQPGQQVLIYGAGGGVGTFAVQLACLLGGQVMAVCGAKNAALVRSLGAQQVLDYAVQDALEAAGQFDLILGVNGSRSLLAYRRALAPGGRFVMIGGDLDQVIKTMLFGGLLSLGGKKLCALSARSDAGDLEWVLQRMAEGQVRAVVERVYPLEETAAAVAYASQGHACGKVVIAVG